MIKELEYLTLPKGARDYHVYNNPYGRGIYTNNRSSDLTLMDLYYAMKGKAEKKPDNYVELYAVINVYAAYQTGGSLGYERVAYTKLDNKFKADLSFLEKKYYKNLNLSELMDYRYWSVKDEYIFSEAQYIFNDAAIQMAKNKGKLLIDGKNYDTQFYRLYYFLTKKNGYSQILVADSTIPLFIYNKNHICRGYIDETARKWHEQELSRLIRTMEYRLGNNDKTGNEFKLVGSKTKRPMTFDIYLGLELPVLKASGERFTDLMGYMYERLTGNSIFNGTYDSIITLENLAYYYKNG